MEAISQGDIRATFVGGRSGNIGAIVVNVRHAISIPVFG
jgi:hypothetical protein